MKHEDWYGCYAGGWQAAPLVPEAYAHPAKVSFTLADRIYRHMLAGGWLEPGDVVVDPFGGVGGFAFHAALYGMHWQGVELEQKFVDLGNQNLALWRDRYAPHFPNYGTARLVQGDSRRLVDVVTGAGGVVSSPPFQGVMQNSVERSGLEAFGKPSHVSKQNYDYGTTPGQLGAMPAGAVVTSPPYAQALSAQTDGIDWTKGKDGRDFSVEPGQAIRLHMSKHYGSTPGQLGAMPAGDAAAVVTSPPYSETRIDGNGDEGASGLRDENGDYLRGAEGWAKRKELGARYGQTAGNLGNLPAGVVTPSDDQPSTFWEAAATIVAQCYAILRPGGYAAFVTGDFVRNKQRVPFGEQWLALCESVGFEPVLWAVAHKEEYQGTQTALFGEDVELTKTKVSFFRRLANRNNPDAAITNEDVLFVRKPQSPRC